MLSDREREQVAATLKPMTGAVRLVFFNQAFGCETCADTKRLLDDLASVAPLVSVVEHNLVLDKAQAEAYKVDRAPAIAIEGDADTGIRILGAPFGYEFSSLLDSILAVSARASGLSDTTRAKLAKVTEPVHIQVFSTPT
jgi:alkyl hydroperoxide reductase subunit AhpF